MRRDPGSPANIETTSTGSRFRYFRRPAFPWVGFFVALTIAACDDAKPQSSHRGEPAQSDVKSVSKPIASKSEPERVVQQKPEVRDAEPNQINRPQPVFRPDDLRTRHDDERCLEAGIRVFESKRLKLYTDIDPTVAQTLPALIDQLDGAWETYLGALPPSRDGSEFQITGYLMRDMALFRELGLMPEEIIIEHGRHRRNEFWMRDQSFDYYRRHLLIHEATHCFMTFMQDVNVPVWYLEGMAEYFGTHRLDAEGRATFQVMPDTILDFAGFGRITAIRDDVAANNARSIDSVMAFQAVNFLTEKHYGWSWALCAFLDGNPKFHDRFQKLSRFTQGSQFQRMFDESFDSDRRDLATEWTLFTFHLQYGFDINRSAIEFRPGTRLTDEQPEQTVEVDAGRGWQSSRVRLKQGGNYQITANGRFLIAEQPKPWISEPQGITFRYFEGNPLGKLLGCLRTEDGLAGGADDPMLQVIPIGAECEFQSPFDGTLYLRLNDAWNSLHDNRGHVRVTIREVIGG